MKKTSILSLHIIVSYSLFIYYVYSELYSKIKCPTTLTNHLIKLILMQLIIIQVKTTLEYSTIEVLNNR